MITMLMDFHIHSNTSSDTTMSAKDIVSAAEAKGIKNICITNHHEPMEIKNGDEKQSLTAEKIDNFMKDIDKARKDAKINVMVGVEMSYTEEEEKDIQEFLARNHLDFVLGTIHYARGWQVADSRNKGKISAKEEKKIQQEYFRVLKKAIKSKMFDAIAHLDHFKRVITEPSFESTKKEWEEVAELLKETGTGFEINTSWSKMSPGGTYPNQKIINLLIDRGVKTITIGSDAHRVTEIGRGIKEAQAMLKGLGVEKVYMFQKRKKIPLIL